MLFREVNHSAPSLDFSHEIFIEERGDIYLLLRSGICDVHTRFFLKADRITCVLREIEIPANVATISCIYTDFTVTQELAKCDFGTKQTGTVIVTEDPKEDRVR